MPRFCIKSECDSLPTHFSALTQFRKFLLWLQNFRSEALGPRPRYRPHLSCKRGCKWNSPRSSVTRESDAWDPRRTPLLTLLHPMPDPEIVIINQKTTACQPKRAHSKFFPLKNIQILSTKKMRENSSKKLIEKRFWFIGYKASQASQRTSREKNSLSVLIHSLVAIAFAESFVFVFLLNRKRRKRNYQGQTLGRVRSIAVAL